MKAIVFASRKGGTGKTTLTGHLAVAAESAGKGPVAVIDLDPQGSLADWWNARESETLLFAKVGKTVAATLKALDGQGVKLVMIDTAPSAGTQLGEVVGLADLVVIPVTPSPHDIRAVAATVDVVTKANRPMVFVLNRATARTRIAADTAVALSQHGAVAPVIVHHRTDFATSMIDGRTVGELDSSGRSAGEVTALWTYLAGRLDSTTTKGKRSA